MIKPQITMSHKTKNTPSTHSSRTVNVRGVNIHSMITLALLRHLHTLRRLDVDVK